MKMKDISKQHLSEPVNSLSCSGRYKIVYTDYTHSVVYFCMSGDDQQACPQHLVHVQILSRLPRIPDDVLQVLYRHVQKTCIPVTSLMDTVPGELSPVTGDDDGRDRESQSPVWWTSCQISIAWWQMMVMVEIESLGHQSGGHRAR